MRFLAYNAVAIVCIGLAGYLAIRDVSGWGWFLVVGAMAAVVPKGKDCQ